MISAMEIVRWTYLWGFYAERGDSRNARSPVCRPQGACHRRILTISRYVAYCRNMDNPEVILTLGALAQTTRLDVFKLLIRSEPNGVAAGEISRILDVPHNTLSTHLGILSRSGLIRSKRYSRSIVYRADLERFREMTLFLLADCCGGNPETCATAIADLFPCYPTKEEANV